MNARYYDSKYCFVGSSHGRVSNGLTGLQPELHVERADYYYQPAGFVGRVFFVAGPQQAHTIPDSTEFILNECKIFTRY